LATGWEFFGTDGPWPWRGAGAILNATRLRDHRETTQPARRRKGEGRAPAVVRARRHREEPELSQTVVVCDTACPPDAAFALVTDPARLREWRRLATVQVAPTGALRVGSRLEVRVPGPLRLLRFAHEVAVLDRAARVYADRALEGPFLVEHGWSVAPHGAGSRLRWSLSCRFRGPARLVAPLLVRAIVRSQQAEGERLRTLLEGETVPASVGAAA
jgi:hypothetical protein